MTKFTIAIVIIYIINVLFARHMLSKSYKRYGEEAGIGEIIIVLLPIGNIIVGMYYLVEELERSQIGNRFFRLGKYRRGR